MSEIVEVNNQKSRSKKGGKNNNQTPVVAASADLCTAVSGTKSYADLLKPAVPKSDPVAVNSNTKNPGLALNPVAGAFDYDKFTKYAQYIAFEHAAGLFRPSDEELVRVKDVAFTHHFNDRSSERYSENIQELKRSLNTTQDCFMYRDTRYALYLPTIEELDLEQGWEIRNEKRQNFEGSYLVFSADFKKVLEVSDREKGERKVRRATQVNVVQIEAEKPAGKNGKSLVERAKIAIAEWNARVARKEDSEQRIINFTQAATHLLSSALETCYELNTVAMISTTSTCIFTQDMGATITCYKNNIRFSEWIERERKNNFNKQQQGAKKKERNEGRSKSHKAKH